MLIKKERQQEIGAIEKNLGSLALRYPYALAFNLPPSGIRIAFEKRLVHELISALVIDHHLNMRGCVTNPQRIDAKPYLWGPMNATIITACLFLLGSVSAKDHEISPRNNPQTDTDEVMATRLFQLLKKKKTDLAWNMLLNQAAMQEFIFEEFMIKSPLKKIPVTEPYGQYAVEVVQPPKKHYPPIVIIDVPYHKIPNYPHWHNQVFTIINRLPSQIKTPNTITIVRTRWLGPQSELPHHQKNRKQRKKENNSRIIIGITGELDKWYDESKELTTVMNLYGEMIDYLYRLTLSEKPNGRQFALLPQTRNLFAMIKPFPSSEKTALQTGQEIINNLLNHFGYERNVPQIYTGKTGGPPKAWFE